MNLSRSIDDFTSEMAKAGLSCPEALIADGKIRRFYVSGDRPGTQNVGM
jgi:hypothetical protein